MKFSKKVIFSLNKYFFHHRSDPLQGEQIRCIQSLCKDKTKLKILDVGCGDGFLTHHFCINNNEVTGIDLKPSLAKTYKFKFVKADGIKLPFDDSLFDLVVSFDVIEHISEDSLFVKECYRVLKKGGTFIIGTPNRERLSYLIKSIFNRAPTFPRNLGENIAYGSIYHIREYTKTEMSELIKETGFIIDSVKMIWIGFYYYIPIGLVAPPKFLEKYAHYVLMESHKK